MPDWLSRLGSTETPSTQEPEPASESAGKISAWLDSLRSAEPEEKEADTRDWYWTGTASEPEPATPETATPAAAEELPDWLRSAGEAAPASAGESPAWPPVFGAKPPIQPEPAQPTPAIAAEPASSEELPDWLRAPSEAPEAAPAAGGELPDWLQSFGAAATPPAQPEPIQPAPPLAAPAQAQPDWLRGLGTTTLSPATPAAAEELPDWLQGLGTAAKPPAQPGPTQPAPAFAAEPISSEDVPDWLRAPSESASAQAAEAAPAEAGDLLPDWLQGLGAPAAAPVQPEPTQPTSPSAATPALSEEVPEWLRSMGETAPVQAAPAAPATEGELPDWLRGLSAAPAAPAEEAQPDWMRGLGTTSLAATPAIIEPSTSAEEQPEWLRSLGVTQELPGETALPTAGLSEEQPEWMRSLGVTTPLPTQPSGVPALEPEGGDEQPEWMRTLGPVSAIQPEGAPTITSAPGVSPFAAEAVSPFEDAGEAAAVPEANLGQLPDWLSSIGPSGAEARSLPEAAQPISPLAGLAQAALPTWLEAMRPVDVERPAITPEVDNYEETVGVLAGLRGVLRSQPVVAQPGKSATKIHKLEVSEAQTKQAGVLAQVLAKATEARRISKRSFWRTAPWARLAVFFILFVAIATPLTFKDARGFFAPISAQPKSAQDLFDALNGLSPAQPVLVAFDYDPAQAGELNPLAQALLSHLERHGVPVVGLSTSPAGAALGETLLNQTFVSGRYGTHYLNLGYLPGGPIGILQLADGPRSVFTTDFRGTYPSEGETPILTVWDAPILKGTRQLSDFSMIVLISATPDTVRTWVEQTQSRAPKPRLVAAVSAGAEPLVRPYYESKQLQGLLSGILGAAQYEKQSGVGGQASGELWDALGWGMLAIIVLLIGGSLFYGLAGGVRRQKR